MLTFAGCAAPPKRHECALWRRRAGDNEVSGKRGAPGAHLSSVSFTASMLGWPLWPSGANSEEVGAAMGSAPRGHGGVLIG